MAVCRGCGEQLPAGARFCPACGDRVGAPEGEERKVVSVLFADLVGSTADASSRDPEDVRAEVQPRLARMRAELERFGGTVEKYVGDAVMAVFGAPVTREDDAERAVRAALAIRDALGSAVKVAVSTGEAVVAVGARPETGEGIAIGDVLNTAYRIEEAAPPGAVLVGEATCRATSGAIEYGERRLIAAKGKADPLPVWEAVRALGPARAPDERAPLAPLVGRREELSLILDTLARAKRDRTVQLVTLVGTAGIGKSRLVWELQRALANDPGLVTWRRGRCLPYGDAVTFWALGEMVKEQAQILETDDSETASAKLHRAVRDVVADIPEADRVEAQLRPLVGLAGTPSAEAESFAGWRRFFESLAEWGPLVLVFEDVHWADDGLLDFIDHLVDWVSGVPLVVVCTARTEIHARRPGWGGRPNAITIALAPLSDADTGRLLGYLLRQPLVPAELQTTLLSGAEGNPLYAEEFVRMLVERGLLYRDDAGWQLRDSELPLPESVQGIIAARLDALEVDDKALLHDAAAIGRVFWAGALAAVGSRESEDVRNRLRALEQREFVRRHRTSSIAGEDEYVFGHSLVRDVAYRQIPRARRSEKHRAIADWLAAVASARTDRVELLAHHLWKASVLARAVGRDDPRLAARARDALREAGDRALALNAFEQAANYFSAALELDPDPAERPRLLFAYGKSLFHARQAGADELALARDALLADGDVEQAAEAEAMIAVHEGFVRGDHDRAFAHLERAAELVDGRPPSPAKAYVLAAFANALGIADEHDRAIAEARRALEIAEQFGLADVEARSLNTLGWLRAVRGDREGLAELERAIALGESSNSPSVIIGYVNLAGVHVVQGDLGRASEVLAAGRRAVERFGRAHGTVYLLRGSRATEDYWRGRWDDAVRCADEFIAREDDRFVEVPVRLVRARIRLARGELAGALDDSVRALELGRLAKDAQQLYPALAFHARALMEAGRATEAREVIDELLGRVTGDEWCMDWFWLDTAVTLGDAGDGTTLRDALARVRNRTRWVAAAEALAAGEPTRAAEICAQIGSAPDEAFARALAAEQLAPARRSEAREHADRAAAFFRAVGAQRYLERVEQSLSAA